MTRKEEMKEIRSIIRRDIERIESGAFGYGGSSAELAKLRRGVGRAPGEVPEILGLILQGVPEIFMAEAGEPTKEEWAIYTALTLYALHRQGASAPVHTEKAVSLGRALARLGKAGQDSNAFARVYGRFRILTSAKDMKELSYHLRGTIQLLRRETIAVNYGMLAADLYAFQFEDARGKLFLRWGQDFFRSDGGEYEGDKTEQEET